MRRRAVVHGGRKIGRQVQGIVHGHAAPPFTRSPIASRRLLASGAFGGDFPAACRRRLRTHVGWRNSACITRRKPGCTSSVPSERSDPPPRFGRGAGCCAPVALEEGRDRDAGAANTPAWLIRSCRSLASASSLEALPRCATSR